MDAKLNVKKVIKKRDRNRVLKALSYIAGFPLLILLVFIGSVPFMDGPGFVSTKYYGVIVCVALWLVIILFQIIAAIVTKNSTARGIIVIIATLIVMIGCSIFFDIWAGKKVDGVRETYARERFGLKEETKLDFVKNQSNKDFVTFEEDEYVRRRFTLPESTKLEYGKDRYGFTTVTFTLKGTQYTKLVAEEIDIPNYKTQSNTYVSWTGKKFMSKSLADRYNETVRNFCRVYNIEYKYGLKGGVNNDGSKYGATTIKKEDGSLEYWFGEKGPVYKENGLFADNYLFSVPVALNILIEYYETQDYYANLDKSADEELVAALNKARTSKEWKDYTKTEEYKAAYGKNGTANSYMITPERLDIILKALGNGIVDKEVLDKLPTFGGVLDLPKMVKDALDKMGLKESDLRNLSLSQIVSLVNGMGIALSEDDILALLGGFSNYEVSNVKPLMYFIKDEKLRTYAYAKYYGEVHGANIGSRLIPQVTKDKDGKPVYGNIGKITMGGSGYNFAENAFNLNACYKLRAENSFVPLLYPLFAARRYTYIFSGIISLMFAIYYYAQMKVNLIGKKIEKMSALGGGR